MFSNSFTICALSSDTTRAANSVPKIAYQLHEPGASNGDGAAFECGVARPQFIDCVADCQEIPMQ